MRADSCSGPTTDSICGHGLGRMGHSSNFARWPHLGPIPPMDGGGHLVPLSYVYGYSGGIGRRSSVEMTPATKLGHQSGDMSSLYGAAWPFLCPNRPFPRWADVGQRKNGRSVEKNLSAVRFLWAVLGGVQSAKWLGAIRRGKKENGSHA